MLRNGLKYLLFAIALSSKLACAASAKDFVGSWALVLEKRNAFVLNVSDANGKLRATWKRPDQYESVNGAFCNLRGGTHLDHVDDLSYSDGALHLMLHDLSSPKALRPYILKLDGNLALLQGDEKSGPITEPIPLQRVRSDAGVATDWQPNRLYTSADLGTSNIEMAAIYMDDQRAREIDNIDWDTLSRADRQRRERTRRLLADGLLHTGKDFERASFIYQHGTTSEDYLLAHTLAVIAVSKGDSTAIWISAATLDRYLQSIGQKQIYGTQFSSAPNQPWTQEPYDSGLISDQVRRQMGVPPLEIQRARLKRYASE